MMISKINGRKTIQLLLFCTVVAFLMQLPYLLGYLTTPEGVFYTGLIMNPEDSQTYWAKMTQGFNGAWAYTIPFTTEAHEPAYVGIFYVWLGQLARLLGISITAVWHSSRIVATIILFMTVYWFIGLFVGNRGLVTGDQNHQSPMTNPQLPNLHQFTFLLAIFGSGLGWLLFILQAPYWLSAFPVDFKQPGAHLFFTAMTFPHITLGTACILISLGMLHKFGLEERKEKKEKISQGWYLPFTIHHLPVTILFALSNLLLGIAYPFLIYLVAGTALLLGLYLMWQKRGVPWLYGGLTAVGFIIPAPLNLYYVSVLQTNEVFKAWDVQAITPSAPWPHYLIAFGPYLWFAWVYWRNSQQNRDQTIILYCWILTVILLLYAPLNPQRRFIQGVQVPLAILTGLAVVQIILPRWVQSKRWQSIVARPRYETKKLARLLGVIFLLFMCLSNIYLWSDITRIATLTQPAPLFRSEDEFEAAKWLREENLSTTVFGTMQTGNLIAAQNGTPVFIGHWAETVDYEAKLVQGEQFFDPTTTDEWRKQLLNQHNIDYVWLGPQEDPANQLDLESIDFLTLLYENSTISIYKFTP
ncbi:MAG: hypothetical protein AAF490_15390 [Chloroflexota bacterium]